MRPGASLLLMGLLAASPARAQTLTDRDTRVETDERGDWLSTARERRARSMGAAEAHLDLARALYFQAVDVESAVGEGLAVLDTLDRIWPPGSGPSTALRQAYRGAFTTLRAKHGWWPPDRLKYTKRGLELLDRAVAAAPDDPEARYLRLMSGFYLPGLFGRANEVRQDLAVLATLLPAAHGVYPEAVYVAVVAFVLRHAELSHAERAALEARFPRQADSASGGQGG